MAKQEGGITARGYLSRWFYIAVSVSAMAMAVDSTIKDLALGAFTFFALAFMFLILADAVEKDLQ